MPDTDMGQAQSSYIDRVTSEPTDKNRMPPQQPKDYKTERSCVHAFDGKKARESNVPQPPNKDMGQAQSRESLTENSQDPSDLNIAMPLEEGISTINTEDQKENIGNMKHMDHIPNKMF